MKLPERPAARLPFSFDFVERSEKMALEISGWQSRAILIYVDIESRVRPCKARSTYFDL